LTASVATLMEKKLFLKNCSNLGQVVIKKILIANFSQKRPSNYVDAQPLLKKNKV